MIPAKLSSSMITGLGSSSVIRISLHRGFYRLVGGATQSHSHFKRRNKKHVTSTTSRNRQDECGRTRSGGWRRHSQLESGGFHTGRVAGRRGCDDYLGG